MNEVGVSQRAKSPILNLQCLRALAAFAVVVYHIHIWEHKNLAELGFTRSWMSAGDVGVDLFFVISGFLMSVVQPTQIRSMKSYARFLLQRFTRIFPPYWAVFLMLLPAYLYAPQLFNNYYQNQVDLVRSFFLVPQDFLPLLSCAWTLIHEVYFYGVVSLLFLLPKRKVWVSAWFVTVLVLATVYGNNAFAPNRWLQIVASPFSLSFILGLFFGMAHERIRRLPIGWSWGAIGISVVGFVWARTQGEVPGVYPMNNELIRWGLHGLPSALLVLAAVGLENTRPCRAKWLLHLGNSSYANYLVHLPIVAGFYALLRPYLLQHPNLIGLGALTCLLMIYVAASLFHLFVELPLLKGVRSKLPK